jgi:hypothetical protein
MRWNALRGIDRMTKRYMAIIEWAFNLIISIFFALSNLSDPGVVFIFSFFAGLSFLPLIMD